MLRPFAGALFLLLCQSAAAQWGQSGVKMPKQSDEKSAEAQQPAYVDCGGLKEVPAFQRPGDLTSKVATLSCGEQVAKLESSEGWVKVRTAKGLESYVSSWFISRVTPRSSAQAPSQPTIYSSASGKLATITACKPGTGVRVYKTYFSVRAYKRLPCGSAVEILHYKPGMLARVRQGDVQGYIQPWHVAEGGAYPTAQQPQQGVIDPAKHPVASTIVQSLAAGAKAYGEAAMGPEQRKCYETLEYRIAELRAQGATEEQLADVKVKGEKVCAHPPEQKSNSYCVPFDPQRGEVCSAYDGVRCAVFVDVRNGQLCTP